ncbi:type II toxin-antitoxin system VapC family toxin [Fervidicoccus fontis]|uniref:Type II toxin-antitoxin system VapC family toxin n=1 Tax=Fervidicoccus fontis TaxID=683846 RepID=A0A843A8R6_9CREN|nr:type II toxin-antitoxin system VapC family toxin [Fervidicoccus fontis]MBE9391243.1 type II toxin-antitoxin system VapC family toxin [Fervidicoccus fontis]
MYLLDASAIINLIKNKKLEAFENASTTDLALYECLNAVWKEAFMLKRLKEETALKLAGSIAKIFSSIEAYSITGFEGEALNLALKEGITFYDAVYLYIAIRNGFTLVTDDEKLKDIASKYIKAMRSAEVP